MVNASIVTVFNSLPVDEQSVMLKILDEQLIARTKVAGAENKTILKVGDTVMIRLDASRFVSPKFRGKTFQVSKLAPTHCWLKNPCGMKDLWPLYGDVVLLQEQVPQTQRSLQLEIDRGPEGDLIPSDE